jgi:hypothetical protein
MTTINFDSETMTFHRQGCNHLENDPMEVGQAKTHSEAMSLKWMQILIEETFEGDSSLVWFQPCTGIKNPAGQAKPAW